MEQEQVKPVPILDAVLVIVVTFFLIMVLGFIFSYTLGDGPALVLTELFVLIIPLAYLLAKHVSIKRYVRLDVNPKLVLWGFVSGAILLSVDIVVSMVLLIVFGESQAVIESNTMITDLSSPRIVWNLRNGDQRKDRYVSSVR